MNELDFIIIGAQKSGTTFLQKLLMSHPQIEMPSAEISFFQYPDYFSIMDLEKEINNLFLSSKTKGIKRPNYIGLEESPMLIEDYGDGDIKLICVLRNPVDRFVSAFFHNIKYSLISPIFINIKIKKIIKKNYINPLYKNLIEFGMYEKYLKKYEKTISKKNLLILDYESLIQNPQLSIDQICNFLNINKVTLKNNLLNKSVNEGSKSLNFLIYQFCKAKIIYKFDKKNMRFFERDKLSFVRLFILKLMSRIFNLLKKVIGEKNLKINKKNIESLKNLYKHDQVELKKFKEFYDF